MGRRDGHERVNRAKRCAEYAHSPRRDRLEIARRPRRDEVTWLHFGAIRPVVAGRHHHVVEGVILSLSGQSLSNQGDIRVIKTYVDNPMTRSNHDAVAVSRAKIDNRAELRLQEFADDDAGIEFAR
jgi:hypothetical protein